MGMHIIYCFALDRVVTMTTIVRLVCRFRLAFFLYTFLNSHRVTSQITTSFPNCSASLGVYGDTCYGALESDNPFESSYVARQACLDYQMDIVTVYDDAQQTELLNILSSTGFVASSETRRLYTGLNSIENGAHVQLSGSSPATDWPTPSWDFAVTEGNCSILVVTNTGGDLTATWEHVVCCSDVGVDLAICEQPSDGSNVTVLPDNDIFAKACYQDVDDCDGITCENNAVCQDNILDFTCPCAASYAGTYCETLLDACDTDPCQNNATCSNVEPNYEYTCNCQPGVTGDDCDINDDDCPADICQNGGTCHDGYAEYTCECLDGFKGSNCAESVDCGVPSAVAGAAILNETGTGFDDVVFYECQNDFKFPDMTTVNNATCDADDQWTDIDPCGPHCLGPVPTLDNAATLNGNTAVGTSVNITCQVGFHFPDNATSVLVNCTSGQTWDPSIGSLAPCSIVVCPELEIKEHQNLDNNENQTYDTEVTFWCDVGYIIFDETTARTVRCQDNGEWSAELPDCDAVECPQISEISNGYRDSDAYDYGATVTYNCDSGYRMADGAIWRQILCDATGQWSDEVSDCMLGQCYPLPWVANASASTLDAYPGTFTTLTCKAGHRFFDNGVKVESKIMTCEGGEWSPLLNACQPVTCPVWADELESQNAENVMASSEDRLYGQQVSLDCDIGHYFPDNASSVVVECQMDETWNNTIIESCIRVKCINPPAITNGDVTNTQQDGVYEYEDLVHYDCIVEHKFINGLTTRDIVCDEFGHWNTTDVTCIIERCDPVPTSENTVPSTTDTAWDIIVTYTCAAGYEWIDTSVGSTYDITCVPGETWTSTVIPDCAAMQCPQIPSLAYASHNGSNIVADRSFGALIQYTCDVGYYFADDDTTVKTRTCDESGQWAPPDGPQFPACELLQCASLHQIENATLLSNDTDFGVSVTYACLEGYQFPDKDTEKEVVCTVQENNTMETYWQWFEWASDDPYKHGNFCEVTFCPPLPTWGGVVFNSSNNDFETTIRYYCQVNLTDGNALYSFQSTQGLTTEEYEIELNAVVVVDDGGGPSGSTTTMAAMTTTGAPTSILVPSLTSKCTDSKAWQPALITCISTVDISDLGEPQEAEGADTIGTFAVSLLCVVVVLVVILDLNKLFADLHLMRRNLRRICRRGNGKVMDSSVDIRAA